MNHSSLDLDGKAAPDIIDSDQLQQLAMEAGIKDSTWSFPPELHRFAELIAGRCASIVESHTVDDRNNGEEIRAACGLG